MTSPQLEPLGDQALLIRWGDSADIAANRRVHALAEKLRAARERWVVDCVPAYASLAVFFDPAAVNADDPMADVRSWLLALLAQPDAPSASAAPRVIEIPVCY